MKRMKKTKKTSTQHKVVAGGIYLNSSGCLIWLLRDFLFSKMCCVCVYVCVCVWFGFGLLR